MTNMDNLGVPQVANRAFVALAIEAGIEVTIKSLVGLARDKVSLLLGLKEALEENNPALAGALNVQTLDAIMEYLSVLPNAGVVDADKLPKLLNENGPAEVYGGRDNNDSSQVNFSYTAPPEGYTAEAYLDGVFVKHSTLAPSAGYVYDILANVVAGAHTLRVLYRNPDGDITRFSTVIVQIA